MLKGATTQEAQRMIARKLVVHSKYADKKELAEAQQAAATADSNDRDESRSKSRSKSRKLRQERLNQPPSYQEQNIDANYSTTDDRCRPYEPENFEEVQLNNQQTKTM